MSDFQVMLFVGHSNNAELDAWTESLREGDGLVTGLFCPSLGKADGDVIPMINENWPDLVCVFADSLPDEDVAGFCMRFREGTQHYRPILIVHSGGSEEDRIQYLIHGADDILRADLSAEEFKVRLLAHLRRNLEVTANDVTRLPGLHFTNKLVQRRLNRRQPVALLLVEVDQLDVYTEVYGELASRQVMKTFATLMGKVVLMPDVISHTEENNFVIVTHPDKAEKIAALLCRQFEAASPNFYSDKYRKHGYMVSVLSGNISRRVPLMSLSIGIASTETQPFDAYMPLFNASVQMKELARMTPGSTWQSDRLKLPGTPAPQRRERPGILVLEPDAALAYLLKTTLEMEGYQVDVASGIEDARLLLSESTDSMTTGADPARTPDIMILDAIINETETGLLLAGEVHSTHPGTAIICTSSLHNRQRVLQAGADLYLPKPFELSNLFFWIRRLLEEGR